VDCQYVDKPADPGAGPSGWNGHRPKHQPTKRIHDFHQPGSCRRHRRRLVRGRRRTARALAADGYRVALLGRRADWIKALAIEADVIDRDALVAAADRVRREFGRGVIDAQLAELKDWENTSLSTDLSSS